MKKAAFERLYEARVASWRASWTRAAEHAHRGRDLVPAGRREAIMSLPAGEAEAMNRAAGELAGELGISALVDWYRGDWTWPDPDAPSLDYWPSAVELPDDVPEPVRLELVRRQARPGGEGMAASALLLALADLRALSASR